MQIAEDNIPLLLLFLLPAAGKYSFLFFPLPFEFLSPNLKRKHYNTLLFICVEKQQQDGAKT